MKISVITVCFNAEETIEETILSTKNQTYKNVEHIIIDGCSTDNTINIINNYKDNVVHFISEPDNGVYDAMNKGIKYATGDFIIFLNANDTFFDENVLDNVVKKLEQNPKAKILFGDIMNVTKDKGASLPKAYNNVKNIFFFIHENICHQCVFYHRSLFNELGDYSNDFKVYADWDFNVKCLVQNKKSVVYLPIKIANFQLGGISSNNSVQKIMKQERKAIINKYYKKFKFIIALNNFFQKNYAPLYSLFIDNYIIKRIYDKTLAIKDFQLNFN